MNGGLDAQCIELAIPCMPFVHGGTAVVLVLGANGVANPKARSDPNSPIYGMPILQAHKARTSLINKRPMAAGYSGIDTELFYRDKTMMIFGDARKVIEEMARSL